jgi:hypothetical protein
MMDKNRVSEPASELSAEENYISAIERQVTGGFVNGGIHKLY